MKLFKLHVYKHLVFYVMYFHEQQFEYWLDWLYTGVVLLVLKTNLCNVTYGLLYVLVCWNCILIYKNY